MKKLVLSALFAGLSWAGLALAGEPTVKSKQLEQVVRKGSTRFLKRVIPESYNPETSEITLWLYTTGKEDCKIKLERKEAFSEKQRDGKQILFHQNDVVIEGDALKHIRIGYAIDGNTPIKASQKVRRQGRIPKKADKDSLIIEAKFKKAPLENAVGLNPSYCEADVEPFFYGDGKLTAQVIGKGMGTKKLNMKGLRLGDRIPDFLTVSHFMRDGKLVEKVRYYDIQGEDSFDLRAETQRPVSESEVKDYYAYRDYTLVPIEKSGIRFQGKKITSAEYLRDKKLLKVVFEDEHGYAPLRRLADNPIVGKLPHFMFRGMQGTYYARIQNGNILIYTSKKGEVTFSKDLQNRCLKVDLDEAENEEPLEKGNNHFRGSV
jgi:hypothetical protein